MTDATTSSTLAPSTSGNGSTRPRVLVILGGRSGEHGISCATAAGFLRAIDREKWDVVPVGITREGEWVRVADDPSAFELKDGRTREVRAGSSRVVLTADGRLLDVHHEDEDPSAPATSIEDLGRIDVVLPLLHGPYGEDGTIQGLLEMADVHYVGCGVTASAVSMDKHLTKTVLASAGIDVGRWEVVTPRDWVHRREETLARLSGLGLPAFVKPCRAGSSLGITRVERAEDMPAAVEEARRHDPRVIVEASLSGREIECGVLEFADGHLEAAPLGEIVLSGEGFYDYDSKYVDTEPVGLECPAAVSEEAARRIRDVAVRAFEALECEGLARVDFFHDPATGSVVVNEVNTMPGFTPFSMYPQMWDRAGLAYPDLIDHLLEVALARPTGLR